MEQLSPEAVAKVKIALLDMLSCAFEAQDLPWSQQAIAIAARSKGGAHIAGTSLRVPFSEAAFVNAILGHGLVREDMHTGSVSHLGVVVLPTLLALAESKKVSGQDFILAAVSEYKESRCAVGRAVMDQENVRQYRPTGITGPIGAAVAGSRLLSLSEDASVSALGFAANTTVGLNEWPYSGGDEMFFHVGFAARNAVTSVELAEQGARASETSLDGPAGLFAALRRPPRSPRSPYSPARAWKFSRSITNPRPLVTTRRRPPNWRRLSREDGVRSADVTAIQVKATAAAMGYPGCNYAGPFTKTLQAKMSIHFCVAAALSRGVIEEANYRNLSDPEINRLAGITTVEIDPALTAAYPGKQGAEVIVTLRDGRTLRRGLSDVVPATPDQIRARFRSAAEKVLGVEATATAEHFIDQLDRQDDAGTLARLLATTHIQHAKASTPD